MKVTIKKSRISMRTLKRLEALGYQVTLILGCAVGAVLGWVGAGVTCYLLCCTTIAFAQGIERGDLKTAIAQSEMELKAIAESDPDAFDMSNLEDTGLVPYMCMDDASYSAELDSVCSKLAMQNAQLNQAQNR